MVRQPGTETGKGQVHEAKYPWEAREKEQQIGLHTRVVVELWGNK